jgi:hypothetical protein
MYHFFRYISKIKIINDKVIFCKLYSKYSCDLRNLIILEHPKFRRGGSDKQLIIKLNGRKKKLRIIKSEWQEYETIKKQLEGNCNSNNIRNN